MPLIKQPFIQLPVQEDPSYSGAEAYFYLSGTTTPTPVYQDAELTTLHDVPVVANDEGRFPAIFAPATPAVRMKIIYVGGSLASPTVDIDPVTDTSTTGTLAKPGGRLTLVSATPVLQSDQTAKTSVFYTQFENNKLPIYDGANMVVYDIPDGEIELALNTTNHLSTRIYDIFAVIGEDNVPFLVTGPVWTNSTTRASAITQSIAGVWTNAAILSNAFNGATDYGPIAIGRATYLGSVYCTANGQTGMAMKPAPAAGGNANVLGLYNAYNRVPVVALCRDTTANFLDVSGIWRPLLNNSNSRISYLDGLAQSVVKGDLTTIGVGSANAINGYVGMTQDATNVAPDLVTSMSGTNSVYFPMSVHQQWLPSLGFHFIQSMQLVLGSSGGTYFSVVGSDGTRQLTGLLVELAM